LLMSMRSGLPRSWASCLVHRMRHSLFTSVRA
jgi:hypothetical protein